MIEITNSDNRVRAGIPGFARVSADKTKATTVPNVAVIKKDRKSMVFCVQENRARIREVTTGPVIDAGQIEILAGLKPREDVIIYGHDSVREDDLVNSHWQQWARRY